MAVIWALAPIGAYLSSWAIYARRSPATDWRLRGLRLLVAWATFSILSLELLSIAGMMQAWTLRALWGVLAVLLTGMALLTTRRQAGSKGPIPRGSAQTGLAAKVALMLLGMTLALSALTAWLAPPHTWDSLTYHMSRVAHWAQEGAVRHYATGIEIQNSRPPGAEMLVLQGYLLTGGDRFANFVSWVSIAGAALGVSYVARLLGARPAGQILAAGFAASAPMAVVQASSTMTDGVAGLWAVAAAAETLRVRRIGVTRAGALSLAAAAALGVATKPTVLPFMLMFLVWAGWLALRKRGWAGAMRLLFLGIGSVIILNGGWAARNVQTYGGIIEPVDSARHAAMPRRPQFLASNLIRHASLHMGTPSPHVNKALTLAILKVHEWLGVDPSDPRITSVGSFSIRRPDEVEEWSPNPAHFGLILLVSAGLAWRWREARRELLAYTAVCHSGFVLFAFIIPWMVFASRLHLPYFLLSGAFVGAAVEVAFRSDWAPTAVLAGLTLVSLPWLLSLNPRPIVPTEDDYVGSVLLEPRTRLYFANGDYLYRPLTSVSGTIQENECSQIGIMLGGNDPEYLLWVLMGAPRDDLRIEWIVAGTPSANYTDLDFQPCAVVCSTCSADQVRIRGLDRSLERAGFSLYLGQAR